MQTLDIDALNTREKLIMLEEIWDSLKDNKTEDLTPDWHLDILEKREEKRNFIDLEDSKKALQDMLKQ